MLLIKELPRRAACYAPERVGNRKTVATRRSNSQNGIAAEKKCTPGQHCVKYSPLIPSFSPTFLGAATPRHARKLGITSAQGQKTRKRRKTRYLPNPIGILGSFWTWCHDAPNPRSRGVEWILPSLICRPAAAWCELQQEFARHLLGERSCTPSSPIPQLRGASFPAPAEWLFSPHARVRVLWLPRVDSRGGVRPRTDGGANQRLATNFMVLARSHGGEGKRKNFALHIALSLSLPLVHCRRVSLDVHSLPLFLSISYV